MTAVASRSRTVRPRMLGLADQGTRVSHAEFARAKFEEPWRYERVMGRLVVMPPSGDAHVGSTEPIRDYLGAYKLSHSDVLEMVVSEAWFFIDEETDRIADIGVYLVSPGAKKPIPKRIPDWVCEIVSAGSEERDYIAKRHEYEQAGVREYVIFDRAQHRATVLRRVRGRFQETQLRPSDTYHTPLLPGLAIPLQAIIG